jgi:hypothetical protein
MRNDNQPGQAVASSNYAPSVPISLYREVNAELQSTKAAMDALKTQNQQLLKQNQQLRQEIDKAVQASLTLRQVANGLNGNAAESTTPQRISAPDAELPPPPPAKFFGVDSPFPAEAMVYEEDSKPRRKIQIEAEAASRELGGWWLVMAIVLIIVTAFGAGFLLVRPFLTPSSSK